MNAGAAEVDWLRAVCTLALGLVVGGALAWRALVAARGAKSAALPSPVRDLSEKRDALVRQLQELDDTASKRTPAQLAHERYALELEAARALLALEEAGPSAARVTAEATAADSAPAAHPSPQRSARAGFFWGVGSATAVLLLGFFVYLSAKPRDAGGSVTGNLPMRGETESAAAPGSEEAELKAALARNPDDLNALLALAQAGVERRDYMNVWNLTAKVLAKEPGNPRALTYQAVVRLAMGQVPLSVEILQKAVASDPRLIEARVYLALAFARLGKIDDARATIAGAKRLFPERAADLQQVLAELENEKPAPAEAPAAAGADPHAGLAAARPEGKATPAPGGRRVAGTIELAKSLQGAAARGVLFVFVRSAHASGGPPIAVKRLAPIFPASFELGQADSMMGQEFPERLLIEARLDSDGDPTTRDPTDPKARLDDVAAGTTNVRLVLTAP